MISVSHEGWYDREWSCKNCWTSGGNLLTPTMNCDKDVCPWDEWMLSDDQLAKGYSNPRWQTVKILSKQLLIMCWPCPFHVANARGSLDRGCVMKNSVTWLRRGSGTKWNPSVDVEFLLTVVCVCYAEVTEGICQTKLTSITGWRWVLKNGHAVPMEKPTQ